MPDTRTPGEICYAAWERSLQQRALAPTRTTQMWQLLPTTEQDAWEAAAQAVLDHALAARVWARQAPSSRWQVVPPEETP
jgi:hypothetical protein